MPGGTTSKSISGASAVMRTVLRSTTETMAVPGRTKAPGSMERGGDLAVERRAQDAVVDLQRAAASFAFSASSCACLGGALRRLLLGLVGRDEAAVEHVDFSCLDPAFVLSQQREGRLRILATAAGQRMASIPDIPTMTELGYPMDLVGWFAAMVPSATPKPIVNQINAWFAKIHAEPETEKFLLNFGGVPWKSTPEEGQARLLQDIKDFAEYIRIAKLKPQG